MLYNTFCCNLEAVLSRLRRQLVRLRIAKYILVPQQKLNRSSSKNVLHNDILLNDFCEWFWSDF